MADAGLVGPDGLHPGAAAGAPGALTGDEWVLEELYHDDELYLLDRKTGKIFTVPGQNTYPRPVGEAARRGHHRTAPSRPDPRIITSHVWLPLMLQQQLHRQPMHGMLG